MKESSRLSMLNVRNYLLSDQVLDQELALSDTGDLSFHWANWKESCEFKKELIQRSKPLKKQFDCFLDQMESLKKRPVWLKNENRVLKTNLYEVYMYYLDPRIRIMWFDNPTGELFISLDGENGSYVTIGSKKWYDPEIYRGFMLKRILTEDMPLRSFRLNLKVPVTCQFDELFKNKITIYIHQLSKSGILFKFNEIVNFNKLLVSEWVTLSLNPDALDKINDQIIAGNKNAMQIHECPMLDKGTNYNYIVPVKKVLSNFSNLNIYRSTELNEFYIFVGFDCLIPETPKKNLSKIILPFLDNVEAAFRKEILDLEKEIA